MPAESAHWPSYRYLQDHFRKHGTALGRTTVERYDESARTTIRVGVRFTYTDSSSHEMRVGYFHRETHRFTAMRADESRILTHFVAEESYVRLLADSTYQR